MGTAEHAVLYDDDFGFAPEGGVFYPEALRLVAPMLAELVGEEMREPGPFNANILLYLDLILGRFQSFHDTHRAAQAVHDAYRTDGRQYCLYLRSFVIAGLPLSTGSVGDEISQQLGLTALDRGFSSLLSSTLPESIASLSFINTFDIYPSGVDAPESQTIPSLRVLSHNWKDIVREAVRGANFVVLNVSGESAGVAYELDLIEECGATSRTVVVTQRGGTNVPRGRGFYEVVTSRVPDVVSDEAARSKLVACIRSLAEDDFVQTAPVQDLSDVPCWVVDRRIDEAAKHFDAKELDGVRYDHYIPSSLWSNWNILIGLFPPMLARWDALEAKIAAGEKPGMQELTAALYTASDAFYIASTLERYYEMSMSLATMGMAHRAITGDLGIMTGCYRHAAQCAEWLGDAELTAFLHDAVERLELESSS